MRGHAHSSGETPYQIKYARRFKSKQTMLLPFPKANLWKFQTKN